MKNYKKGFAPVVLLIIIAVVAIGGGAYYYTQNGVDKTNTQATSTIQTTNWKTYSNAQYGFEFKYPVSAKQQAVELATNPSLNLNFLLEDSKSLNVTIYSAKKYHSQNIIKKLQSLNANFDGYKALTSETDNLNVTEGDGASYQYLETKIKIDNKPALSISHCGGGDTCGREIYILIGDNVFTFEHYGENYLKSIPDACGQNCSKTVSPLQVIDEKTVFDAIILTIKFSSPQTTKSSVNTQPFNWYGKYEFGEVAPANPNGGSVQSWQYKLLISSTNGVPRMYAELD
ncbi:hypothetical protein KW782_04670, partial [Candidatus Parcubacteria bacterium]|nr:hypothetical protein [Candidatus Parcubacteria bacterium]